MQHDDVVWDIINHGFCSFKVKLQRERMCKNPYNVTGLCNRKSCPLANSRYATVREEGGRCFLYIKVVERIHYPARMWEKVKLSRNFAQAVKQINEHLAWWPKLSVHRCKQRLTKIHQYLMRMRRLALAVRPQLVGIKKKVERREASREAKAEKAARLEDAIKNELIQRLKQGTYDEIYAPDELRQKALEEAGAKPDVEREDEDEEEAEAEEGEVEEEEEEEEIDEDELKQADEGEDEEGLDLDDGEVEFVEADDEDIMESDMEDMVAAMSMKEAEDEREEEYEREDERGPATGDVDAADEAEEEEEEDEEEEEEQEQRGRSKLASSRSGATPKRAAPARPQRQQTPQPKRARSPEQTPGGRKKARPAPPAARSAPRPRRRVEIEIEQETERARR